MTTTDARKPATSRRVWTQADQDQCIADWRSGAVARRVNAVWEQIKEDIERGDT